MPLGLKYYSDMKYAPLSELLRQASVNTDNQLMEFSDYSWQDCPDTGRITGEYIISYQCGPIDNSKHVPVPVSKYSEYSD